MSRARDFGELVTLLALEKNAYELLLSLSRGQVEVFERDGADALMKVIARKQDVVCRIAAVEARLELYTSRWQDTMAALPEQGRQEVAALVDAISLAVAALLDSERAMEAALTAVRDAAAERMRSVNEGLVAARAYGAPAVAATGQLLDGEG